MPAKVVVAHDVTHVFKKNLSSKKVLSLPIGFQDFPLAEIEWNLNHKIIRWSKRAELMFGYSHNDISKNPYLLEELIADEYLGEIISANKDAQQENAQTKILSLKNKTKDGGIIVAHRSR